MWRRLFSWVAAHPEQAISIVLAGVTLLNVLAVALEKRMPRFSAVLRSLSFFVVGAVRAVQRPDASTGPAAPALPTGGSYRPPPPLQALPAPLPTRETPKVPPVVLGLFAGLLVACGVSSAQVAETAKKLDVADAALEGVVSNCTERYKAAAAPEDLAKLDAYCPATAEALDAVKVSAAALRAAAGLVGVTK